MSKYGHLGTTACQSVLPGTKQHRDRHVVRFSRADEVDVHEAIEVKSYARDPPP